MDSEQIREISNYSLIRLVFAKSELVNINLKIEELKKSLDILTRRLDRINGSVINFKKDIYTKLKLDEITLKQLKLKLSIRNSIIDRLKNRLVLFHDQLSILEAKKLDIEDKIKRYEKKQTVYEELDLEEFLDVKTSQ